MGRLEKIVVLTVVFLIAVILAVSVYDPSHAAGVGDDPSGSASANLSGMGPSETGDSNRGSEFGEGREVARRDGPGSEAGSGGGDLDGDPLSRSFEDSPEGSTPAFEGLRPLDRVGPLDGEETDSQGGGGSEVGPRAEDSADSDPAPFTNPNRGSRDRAQGGRDPRRGDNDRGALLDASVQLNGRPPAGSILKTLSGLEGAEIAPGVLSPDYYTYTWKSGDDLSALARRYYRSVAHVGLLRMSNEGVDFSTLGAGTKILIPVYGGETSRSDDRLDGFYEVVDGDNLSKIARAHYGDGNLYPILIEANRDLIKSADELEIGMRIRIPRR